MSEIIDKKTQIASEFVTKMRKEKSVQHLNHSKESKIKIFEEQNDDKQLE
jgi:hypothetical protein